MLSIARSMRFLLAELGSLFQAGSFKERHSRQLRRPTERVQALRRSQCTAGANIFLGGSLNRRYQNEKDFLSAEERHERRDTCRLGWRPLAVRFSSNIQPTEIRNASALDLVSHAIHRRTEVGVHGVVQEIGDA